MTPQDAHKTLTRRLSKLQACDARYRAAFGLGLALSIMLGAGLLSMLLEAAFYLRPAIKIALEGVGGIAVLALLGRYAIVPLVSPPDLDALALRIEAHFGGLQQQLISARQLWRTRDQQAHSTALVDAAVLHAVQQTAPLDFSAVINRIQPARMCGLAAGLAVLVFALYALWPAFGNAAYRLSHPQMAFERPPDTHVALHPGDAEVIAGEPFEIRADLSGIVPRQARLYTRENDVDVWTPIALTVRQNTVRHRFPAVTRSFAYRLQAHDAESSIYHLRVRQRPMVVRILHTDRFPSYTQRPDRHDQSGGDIVAPKGTEVALQIETNHAIEEAWLTFDDGTRRPAQVDQNTAAITLTVKRDARYTVGLRDPHQITNRDPVEYRLVALPDRPPDVRLLRPGRDIELGEAMRVSLVAEAFDDYGISKMEIRYQVGNQEDDLMTPIPLSESGREVTGTYVWDVSRFDLLPGDQITYRVRAYDNNPDPSFGETPSFVLRFPSLFEIHEAAERTQRESLDDMAAVQERGQELQERLEDMARDLIQKEAIDWQDQQEIEQALQNQEQLTEQLESTAEKLEQALNQLEESGLLEDDTLSKLQEIQELMAQIQTPELKAAMEKLQEAVQSADPELVREALEDFKAQREQFQKALDRTISLLQRVQQQQTLDALTKKLDALAEAQKQVTRDAEDQAPLDELARKEAQIARDTDKMREELQQAAEKMENAAPTDQQLSDLADKMQAQQLTNRMNQVQRDLEANRRQRAQKGSKSLADDLQQLSEQLDKTRQQFLSQQKTEIARELNRVLHDLLALSQAQERTAQRAETAQSREETAPLALDQARTMTGANRMAQRLLDASQQTFFMPPQAGAALGNALNKMEDAAEQLNGGNGNRAAQQAREAMGALNSAAMMVQRALGQLASSESGTGFEEMMEQMSQLANQQGNLNAQTESLFGQPQPGPNGQPGWPQLAAQQRAIQQALNALRQELARQQQQALGDLGKIAGDMSQTADELRQRQITPQTIQRQQQILSRLLDAQKSMRQRGKTRQREAKTGQNMAYRGPGSLPTNLGEADNPLRERLRDALKEGYSAEYQALIRQYFETLMQDAATQTKPKQSDITP